jgi:hypothetical protein
MTEDFDREKRKISNKHFGNKQKHKDKITDEEKLSKKAKKAFKNRIQSIRDEEILDDIENYGYKYS